MTIQELLQEKQQLINDRLLELLPSDCKEHQRLFDAMNYSLNAGGKRIRPFLLLAVLEIVGKDSHPYLDVACALECIHTYSLIHDDLPAMDNDDYRRGKPTNHTVYGAGMATMAGDGLLTYAFELLASQKEIAPALRCELIAILAKAAGPSGMVGGQAHDIDSENKDLTLEELQLMDHCKTGCLLCASVDMAVAIAGVNGEDAKTWHDFASHLGLLFPITDDLLDVNGHLDEMGKMPNQDTVDHKSTYVTILGKESAFSLAKQEAQAAKTLLKDTGRETKLLEDLVDMLLVRTK